MGKKSTNWGWFWLIVILIILFFLWVASQVTDDPKVKQYQDHYKDEAEELKQQIRSQENVVGKLKTELRRFTSVQGYLINKAKRIYFAIRCVGGIIIISTLFFIHGILNFSMVEVIGTITTTGGFLYIVVSGMIWNEVKGVNEVLKLFYDAILRMTYHNHEFEPALIEVLELKIEKETTKLDQMKSMYQNITNSNIKINEQ